MSFLRSSWLCFGKTKINKIMRNLCGFLILCAVACRSAQEEINLNIERGNPIVGAIDKYKQDHRELPKELQALLPTYLPSLPKTIREQDFAYKLDELEGYYLCFDVPASTKSGCCYNARLAFWDCGFGH